MPCRNSDRSWPFFATFKVTELCRLEFFKKKFKKFHKITTVTLSEKLLGEPPDKLPLFDLSIGIEFQRNICKILLRIPLGKTKFSGKSANEMSKSIKNSR